MIYRIGVDGGASKTECILVDESGAVVSRQLAPGCNPNVVGAGPARTIIVEALGALRAGAQAKNLSPQIAVTLLCMAGPAEFWREFASELAGFGRVLAADDSLPVLELATNGGPGLVLHAGTGSFVAARRRAGVDGKDKANPLTGVHYAGGLGWRFGDPGSGYDLGRRAIAHALLELQGWLPPSGLSGLIRAHTGLVDAGTITRHFYADPSPNPGIAGLAPGVLKLAGDGDAAALALAVDSTGELLHLAVGVAKKLFAAAPPGELVAGLSGPILTHPAVLPELIRRSPFRLHPIAGAPIEGVRRLLLRDY